METKEKICAICNSSATQKCSGCDSVYYCDRQHQKKDWNRHSQFCRAFKIATDPVLGRHYIASRNIKVGEIVLKETKPLVAGPISGTPAVCLSCYLVLTNSTATPCSKCGWPLCPDCKEHGPECEFTSSRRDRPISIGAFGMPHPTYNCINVIKALALKKTNPQAYERLLSLENHMDLMKIEGDSRFGAPSLVVDLMRRLFKMDDILDEEILKIIGVVQVNGHEVPTTEPAHMAVYDLASFLEHNCLANCAKSFTDDGGLIIHAAVPILKGEHISISYTDSLWGASNRRHHLLRTKFFECTCVRCKDPTELGTMYNAIKCIKTTCSGNMLPITFLSDDPGDYSCNKCDSTLSSSKVEEILERIGQDLASMRKNSAKVCSDFIRRYKAVLHENHFYNTDVNVALAQLTGDDTGLQDVSDEELHKNIALCKKLDALLTIIAPAEVRIRGILLFQMHAMLAECSKRDKNCNVFDFLQESKKYLIEARKLLQHEPPILAEGKIAVRAKKNLQEIDAILKTLYLNSITPV